MKIKARFVHKYGKDLVEITYEDYDWCGWLFPFSYEKKHLYTFYIPELGVYIRNTSID